MRLEVDGIEAEGDAESDNCLHSLARSYFLEQYGDASDLGDGLDAFEAAVLDTVLRDGIGEHAGRLGNPIRLIGALVTEHIAEQ